MGTPTFSDLTPWYRLPRTVELVLEYCEPRTAFGSRLVCHEWYIVLTDLDSRAWRHIFFALVPSARRPTQSLEFHCSAYRLARRYARNDVIPTRPVIVCPGQELRQQAAPSRSFPNLIVADANAEPIVWFTDVPHATVVSDIVLLAMPLTATAGAADELFVPPVTFFGTPLDPTLPICVRHFPTRPPRGATWRGDAMLTLDITLDPGQLDRVSFPTVFRPPTHNDVSA